ncbi:metallophosphoesterase family protein [Acidaminococcus fermentans]|uniref:metallophosphoesterase family protein n=1 Tax=Acidaminococcus fermentans TaxID=905 RepID=UPI003A9556AD
MIYLTGDIHGSLEFDRLRPESLLSRGVDCRAGDILFVCGDFGIPWADPDRDPDRSMLEEIAQWPYTVAFVDGNHENFPRLNGYPVIHWKGGQAHRLLPNLFHLMRGELFDLEGHTFFTMGGAMSADRWMRRKGISWWPEEIPSEAEWQHAWDTLDRAGWKVDYVVTHTAPTCWKIQGGMRMVAHLGDKCPVARKLEELESHLTYRRWFFGHLHDDRITQDGKAVWLYEKVVDLEGNSKFKGNLWKKFLEGSYTYPMICRPEPERKGMAQPLLARFPDFPEGKETAVDRFAPGVAGSKTLIQLILKTMGYGKPLPCPASIESLKRQMDSNEELWMVTVQHGVFWREEKI